VVRFLDAGFAEHAKNASQESVRSEGDALARYGNNMVPVDFYQAPAEPTRVFVYPYVRTMESLNHIATGVPDPHLGHKLRYVNPATGASPMPTIGAFTQRLPAGFETRSYQCTDGTVYVCLEGEATVAVGETEWQLQRDDIFVVPSWQPLKFLAQRDTTLFSFSDRPIQQSLGLWREARL
jgi:gentisate 1,2-dioxygenase